MRGVEEGGRAGRRDGNEVVGVARESEAVMKEEVEVRVGAVGYAHLGGKESGGARDMGGEIHEMDAHVYDLGNIRHEKGYRKPRDCFDRCRVAVPIGSADVGSACCAVHMYRKQCVRTCSPGR